VGFEGRRDCWGREGGCFAAAAAGVQGSGGLRRVCVVVVDVDVDVVSFVRFGGILRGVGRGGEG
jgi:hypothetical protein